MWFSKAAEPNSESGGSNPSQAVRLLWFFLFQQGHSGVDVLIQVLWISAASLAVTLFCAMAQPTGIIDEVTMTRVARANRCFALIDTLFFVLLIRNPSVVDPACQLGAACRTYPVGWLALAGMHYCYAVWAYVTMLVNR